MVTGVKWLRKRNISFLKRGISYAAEYCSTAYEPVLSDCCVSYHDWPYFTNLEFSFLGGVTLSMLSLGPKVRGFRLRRGDGYLRAIKIRSTPSFEEEVNPEVPYRKILRRVKVSYKNEQKYYASQDLSFPSPVPPACYQITLLVGMPGSSVGLIRSFTLSTSFHHASPCSHITWKWTIFRWWP
jgi:hypothetical protein